jgi:two-component system phosphate regulon sensor histidine kinase PhoR
MIMSEELTKEELLAELSETRIQLEEANDTIEAIKTGMVDAFVVHGKDGHQLYTLKTADLTYRVIIEKMGEGAITLNNDGLILYSNSRFAELVDLPLDSVIGRNLNEFIQGHSLDGLFDIAKEERLNGYKSEESLISSAQRIIPVLLSVTRLNLEDGTALSILFTDLTLQKESQGILKVKNEQLKIASHAALKLNDELESTVAERTRDLSVSREHFILLSNNIPQITWTNLPEGRFNFFNERWYDYTGLSFDATFEEAWKNVIHPEDLAATRVKFLKSLKLGTVFEMENRYLRHDGIYRWHLNRGIPLRDEAGEILFWVGTATDIDDQRKALEKQDEFIGIASHELKTPLTSLKAYVQLMNKFKKEQVPEQVRTFIEKASTSINKLQILVNDLLDVSKIQAGKLFFSQTRLEINALVANWVENARYMYPANELSFKPGTECFINGNAERLEQVVMNLINNAQKYSPQNKCINLAVEVLNQEVKISVTDFGIGLSSEQQQRIFERFYRVDDRNLNVGGLGMGLYISMEIIKNHNGSMGVESAPGKGSTFFILIPILID